MEYYQCLAVAGGVSVLRQGKQPGNLYDMQKETRDAQNKGTQMYAVWQAYPPCGAGILS